MKKTLCGEIEGEYCVRFLLYLLLHSNKKILQKQLGTDFTLFRCGSKVHIFIPEGWLRAIVEKEKRVYVYISVSCLRCCCNLQLIETSADTAKWF